MANPPINQEQFLTKLGKISANTKPGKIVSKNSGIKPFYSDGLSAQIDKINKQAEEEKAAYDSQSLVKKGLIKTVGSPVFRNVMKPLSLLDTPRRAVISAVRETVDALDNDPTTNASMKDLIKQTKDFNYGFGTAFPMKGWAGRVVGFVGDVLLDPLTYATLGGTVAKKAVVKGAVDALGKPLATRAALGGIKNIGGRQGRQALAGFAKERLVLLRQKGLKITEEEIFKIQKNVASRGKSALPGFLAQDIGIKGPGIYYFGSRVKVPGSGIIGDFVERGLTKTRLGIVSPKYKLNPGQYIHSAITLRGTGTVADLGSETIAEARIKLANGTFQPKEADIAIQALEADDFARASISMHKEKGAQVLQNVTNSPSLKAHTDTMQRVFEDEAYRNTLDPNSPQMLLHNEWKNLTNNLREILIAHGQKVEPTFNVGFIENHFPHMQSDEAIKRMQRIGKEEFDKLIPQTPLSDAERIGASFNQRYVQEGQEWFGHVLTKNDLRADTLNFMARNPIPNKKNVIMSALDFDLYEIDAEKVLAKYVNDWAQSMGHFDFMQNLINRGTDMSQIKRVFKTTPDIANIRAKEAGDVVAKHIQKIDEHGSSIGQSLADYNKLPRTTSEEIVLANNTLHEIVNNGSTTHTAVIDDRTVFDNTFENVDNASNHMLVVNNRDSLLNDFNSIKTQQEELLKLEQEAGQFPNIDIEDKRVKLVNDLEQYRTNLDKFSRDINELQEVHNVLPKFSGPKSILEPKNLPEYQNVLDVLETNTTKAKNSSQIEGVLKFVHDKHAAFEIGMKGKSELQESLLRNPNTRSKQPLSSLAKKIETARLKLKSAEKITNPVLREKRLLEATFLAQDTLHEHLSILQFTEYSKLANQFGIKLGDVEINQIFADIRRPYQNASEVYLKESKDAINVLTDLKNKLYGVNTPAVSTSATPGGVTAGEQIRSIFSGLSDAFKDINNAPTTATTQGTRFPLKKQIEILQDFFKTNEGKLIRKNNSNIGFPRDANGEINEKSISKWFDMLLGSPTEEGIFPSSVILHEQRLKELTSEAKIYGRNQGTGIFGSFDFAKHSEDMANEIADRVKTLHKENVTAGVSSALRSQREKEFSLLPKRVRKVFDDFLVSQKRKIKFISSEVSELKNSQRTIKLNLKDLENRNNLSLTLFQDEVQKNLNKPSAIYLGENSTLNAYFQNLVLKHFPDAGDWYQPFHTKHNALLNFVSEVGQKTGVMTTPDAYYALQLVKDITPGMIAIKSVPESFTYEEFQKITLDYLSENLLEDVQTNVSGSVLQFEKEIATYDKSIRNKLNEIIRIEDASLKLTPNEFVNSPNGGSLVEDALRLEEGGARNLVPEIPNVVPASTKSSEAQSLMNELENNEYWPIAKSLEKRANVLYSLTEIDGNEIDWTLGSRVAPPTQLGKPLNISPDAWRSIVYPESLVGHADDEVATIVNWLKQNDVMQIISPNILPENISDEMLVKKFVQFVRSRDVVPLTEHVNYRQKHIENIWNISDAKKYLGKHSEYKKIILEENLKKQKNSSLRLIDNAESNFVQGETIRGGQERKYRDYRDMGSVTDFNKKSNKLMQIRDDLNKHLENLARTEDRPLATIAQDDLERNIQNKLDTLMDELIDEAGTDVTLSANDIAIIRDEQLQKIYAKTKFDEAKFKSIEIRLAKSGKEIDEILSIPVLDKTSKELEEEIIRLQYFKEQNIDTPYIREKKFNNLIRERQKELRLRTDAKERKMFPGENLSEFKPKDIPLHFQENIPYERRVQSLVDTGRYSRPEAEVLLRDAKAMEQLRFNWKKDLRNGPQPDLDIQSWDTGRDVNLAAVGNESVPIFPTEDNLLPGWKVTKKVENQPYVASKNQPYVAPKVSRVESPRPTTIVGVESKNQDGVIKFLKEFNNLTDANLAPINPVVTPIASKAVIQDPVQHVAAIYTPELIAQDFNPNVLASTQEKIKEAADIVTQAFETTTAVATPTQKAKFVDNYFKGIGDVSGTHRNSMQFLREGYQLIDEIITRGNITPMEQVLVDGVHKEAEWLKIAGRLADTEVQARLLTGAAEGTATGIPGMGKMLKDGWEVLGGKYPSIQASPELAELWKNASYFESPKFARELTNYIGGFTKFHKAYATFTPGFHVRNAIGNAVQFVLAGGKMENIRPATEIYVNWTKAYKKGITWEKFLETEVEEQFKELANVGRYAMHGSGGGIFGDTFHAAHRGSKVYDNKATRWMGKWGQTSDNMSRFILGFDSAAQGMNRQMSTARVRKFYFDYEDLSNVDKVIKQIVPFWIWTSRNLPLQVENMWLNPKPYLIYNSFVRNIRDKEAEEQNPLPSFLQEVGAFTLPGGSLYAAPDLNFTRVSQQAAQLGNPKKLATNFNPLLRVPLEQALGQNLYNDEEMATPQERLIAALQGLVVPVATGDRLLNSYGKAKTNAWLGFGGSPIKDI